MKILLIDVDSKKVKNLPLMQIKRHYRSNGHEVGFNVVDPDKVYISCVFTKNGPQARGIATKYPNAEVYIGGTGVNFDWLPEKMQKLKPDYSLYPDIGYSMGFTSRGCFRKCPFCFVPDKEGKLRIWQHPSEFHDDKFDTCMILDNNLLACDKKRVGRDWWKTVLEWFRDNDIKIWEGGLDARILTEEQANLLADIKLGKPDVYRFAFDNLRDQPYVEKAINLMKSAGVRSKNLSFYVLVGHDTTHEEDVYRVNFLRDHGVNSALMPFNEKIVDYNMKMLDRYTNNKFLYWGISWNHYKQAVKEGKWRVGELDLTKENYIYNHKLTEFVN